MVSSFEVRITISRVDGSNGVEVPALVDTASTLVVVSPSIAGRVGLLPLEQRPFRLGNEDVIHLPVANALIKVDGRSTAARVAISPEEGTAILGVTVLELLGLMVDPVGERLVPVEYLFKPVHSSGLATVSP